MNQQKLYKCQHCKASKPAGEFYRAKAYSYGAGKRVFRTSPYCKACNTEAVRYNGYKAEAKANPKAFAAKIKRKDNQLSAMLKALSEVRI